MIKIHTRSELNRMTVPEIKKLLKLHKMGIALTTKEEMISLLLSYYKKLYFSGKLYVRFKEDK